MTRLKEVQNLFGKVASVSQSTTANNFIDKKSPMWYLSCMLLLNSGFPPALEILENLEKWDNFFQSGKSQGILKKY